MRQVSVITPGVLGQTGIDAGELIKAAAEKIKPAAVIVIDALAAQSGDRLFKTVQLCDTGISPGSGVKNNRGEISEKTVGVPVIAIGVPTVIDADTLSERLTGISPEKKSEMFVTPKACGYAHTAARKAFGGGNKYVSAARNRPRNNFRTGLIYVISA